MERRLKYIIVIALIVTFIAFSVSLEAKGKEQAIKGKAKTSLNGAKISMQQGNYAKALGQYLEVEKNMPNHVFSIREIAGLYYTMAEEGESGSIEEEVSTYKKANEYCIKTISTIESIADWRSYEGFEEYRETVTTTMQSIYARLFNLGKEMYDDQEIDTAKSIYEELTVIDPQRPQAYQMLAVLASESGDEELKLEYLRRLGNIAKDNPDVLNMVAGEYLTAKNYDDALQYYQMYIDLKPNEAIGYLSKGGVYWEMENFDEAYKCFQKALELEPNNVDVVVNALAMAQKMKDNDKLLEYARKWVALDESKDSLEALCTILIQNREWAEFITYGKKWHATDPTDKDIVQYIIYAAGQAKDSATENEFKEIQKKM